MVQIQCIFTEPNAKDKKYASTVCYIAQYMLLCASQIYEIHSYEWTKANIEKKNSTFAPKSDKREDATY